MMERLSKFRVDDDWIDREIAYLKKRMNDDSNDALRTAISVQNLFALLEEIKERRESDTNGGVAMERVMKKERLTAEDCEKMFKSGVIKRVDDEILDALIAGEGNIIAGSWNAIIYALCELKVRRKAEKEHGHTDNSASEKDGAGAMHEREKAVLPFPVKQVDGVDVKKWTVKQWFAKINEELDEMKEVVLRWGYMNSRVNSDFIGVSDNIDLAEEAADTITAITSMLEAIGIDEQQRQEAQRRVNEMNKKRGRF